MSSIRLPWGNAFENMTDEARNLQRQFRKWCDECPKAHDFTCSGADAKRCEAEKDKLLTRLLDITDTRNFCVVCRREDVPVVRHIFRVTEDAEDRMDEVKADYYEDYEKFSDDEFHFFRGLHRAQAFAEAFRKGD